MNVDAIIQEGKDLTEEGLVKILNRNGLDVKVQPEQFQKEKTLLLQYTIGVLTSAPNEFTSFSEATVQYYVDVRGYSKTEPRDERGDLPCEAAERKFYQNGCDPIKDDESFEVYMSRKASIWHAEEYTGKY